MEVDGLGARCTLSSCRTLDYLPFTCPSCAQQFCNEHRTPASHFCKAAASRIVPTCPACSKPVPVPPGSTPDVAVSRHIDAGCPKRKRANPICAARGCSVRDPASTTCPSCRNVFCLQHRIEAQHDCAAVTRAQPARSSKAKEKARKPSKRRSGRTDFLNSPREPIGDKNIEADERITVAVFFPDGTGVQPRYMFFSKKNSAGKIIDGLRKSIPQIPSPDDGERYFLYAVKNGGYGVNQLPYITPLKDLGAILQTGDMLVLESGDQGLDPTWTAALRKLAPPTHLLQRSGSRSKVFGKWRHTTSSAGKSDQCAVA